MDIVEQLIEKHAAGLVGPLVERLGFDAEQARAFVPVAVRALVNVVQGGELDLGSLLGGGAGSLASKVDLAPLAQESGVGQEQARAGLEQIAPGILEALQGEAGGAEGIGALLGGKGGAAGALGKLFGR